MDQRITDDKLKNEMRKLIFENEITPENDQQELWEQNGRVKALKAYARLRDEMSTTDIIVMLGGEVDGE